MKNYNVLLFDISINEHFRYEVLAYDLFDAGNKARNEFPGCPVQSVIEVRKVKTENNPE